MNDVELALLTADAQRREDVRLLSALSELRKTRKALRAYLKAHVNAINAVGTGRNSSAGLRFWRAYRAAWKRLARYRSRSSNSTNRNGPSHVPCKADRARSLQRPGGSDLCRVLEPAAV